MSQSEIVFAECERVCVQLRAEVDGPGGTGNVLAGVVLSGSASELADLLPLLISCCLPVTAKSLS